MKEGKECGFLMGSTQRGFKLSGGEKKLVAGKK